jgi:MGT family glycosyltransferase
MGTTVMDERAALERVIEALGALPVRALVTVGQHLDADSFVTPPNVSVRGYVPHAAVLPYASAVVTHAGLGTVLAALAHGVPLVCLPLGREQPDNAAAVERVGAGVVLSNDADPSDIRAAITDVLETPQYQLLAAAMAATIDSYGRGQLCVDELERLSC